MRWHALCYSIGHDDSDPHTNHSGDSGHRLYCESVTNGLKMTNTLLKNTWYHLEDYKFYRVWSFGKIRVGYYMVVFGGRNHRYNHSMWMVR